MFGSNNLKNRVDRDGRENSKKRRLPVSIHWSFRNIFKNITFYSSSLRNSRKIKNIN